MLLHPLTNWQTTRDSLHAVTQVMAEIRKAGGLADPIFHQHVTLIVKRKGLLARSRFGTLMFHWADAKMGYVHQRDREPIAIAVEGHTQKSLYAAIREAILLHSPEPFVDDDDHLDNQHPLHINLEESFNYGQSLKTIATSFEDFYGSLPNNKTPLVLYPHHFDYSFLWFKGEMTSEQDHHINFGFAPYSEGIDRPYFYTYAYPAPEGYHNITLPPLVQWSDRWNGTIMYYDDILKHPFPMAVVRNSLRQILKAVAPLIPVEEIEVKPKTSQQVNKQGLKPKKQAE
jgi:hypothetical protein